MSTPEEIDVQTLKAKLDQKAITLLDVRTDEEYQVGHLEGLHIPLNELVHQLDAINVKGPIACICRSGGRSLKAMHLLKDAGFEACNVKGGVTAWQTHIDPTFKVG